MEPMTTADQIIDPNFTLEPQIRSRCNTWPLRPIVADSPSVHDSENNSAEPAIKEEPEEVHQPEHEDEGQSQLNLSGGPDGLNISNQQLGINNSELGSQGDLNAKKQSARKNAWGNLSYADLITKAIQSSPDKRLTLSQIYDWMVQNVVYFRDKGDSNSSAGWKNSIRHNLSLHNRFMRIQNEGAGKSSWWVINPDAKPGKAPRRPRGGSMDSKSVSMKSSRDRAMKKVREMKKTGILNKDGTISPVSPANEFTLSPGDGGYRDRASSFASSISGRRSPVHDPDHDPKLSPWGSDTQLDCNFDYSMDTGGKLPDDIDLVALKFPDMQTGSLLNELEEINEPYGDGSTSNMGPQSIFAGKPYTSYLQGGEPSGTYPPPPYPSTTSDQQQNYNTQTAANSAAHLYSKDPMMTGYNGGSSTGNNNSLRPQFAGGYTNGIMPNQTVAQQLPRLGQPQMTQSQQPQRVLPNSIRAALGNSAPMPRTTQISQSLKDSAPILTSQLMSFPSGAQQSMYSPNQPQANRQQSMAFGPFTGNAGEQMSGFGYTNAGNGPTPNSSNPYFPNDIDLEALPELLSCDVDEIIQQEVQMDGGQLDFAGFEGYTANQQQQQASSNQSGTSNIGIGLS